MPWYKRKAKNIFDLLLRLFYSFFGNREYCKFVIISRSRTGSNLLISLLRCHPDIEVHGEIFRYLNGGNASSVWDRLFCNKAKNIRSIGFKIFYYHPLDSDDRTVWKLIQNDKDIRIIHLKRENLLRTCVSREIAGKLGVWKQTTDENIPVEAKKVSLDVESCLDEFGRIREWEKGTADTFRNHPYMELTYENLTSGFQEQMNEVFQFLQTSPVQVDSSMKKQNTEKLQDLVRNYEEVKRGLSAAGYTALLEEK